MHGKNIVKKKEFIKNGWDGCVRYFPEDKDTLIGLPYPSRILAYVISCGFG